MQAISYKDGDYVKKGTSLFTIEPEPYKLKVDRAKAAVVSAQAALTQAQAEFDRQAALIAEQVSTQANYDKALASAIPRRPICDRAVKPMSSRPRSISATPTSTAPFDGIVTARAGFDRRNWSAPVRRRTLATIVQLDPIWVNFTASERDVLRVRALLAARGETTAALIGLPVEVGLQNETGYPHKGRLDYIAPIVDPSTGTLAGRATLENGDHQLLPGYFVRVRIPSKPAPALLVPDIAVGSDQAGRYVLVVNKDNVVEQRKVEPGQLVGEMRVIESGLTKDDRVVVGGIMRAIPGEKVDAEMRSASAAK